MKTIKLSHCTFHDLSITQESIDRVYPGRDAMPIVATGIIEADSPTLNPGDHTRTSLICKIEGNLIYTLNSIYEWTSTEPDPFFPENKGEDVLKLFY